MSETKADSFKDFFDRGEIVVARQQRVSMGHEVEGIVGHISPDSVLVDLDDKQQAYFDLVDLKDANGRVLVAVGDRIKGYVVSTDGGEIKLGKRFGKGEVSVDHLVMAKEQGTPIEGKVTGVNKGGVEVELAGVRAFCPASQLDDHFVDDTSRFIGQTLAFLVTRVEGKNVVVSRRALLGREAKETRVATLAAIQVGDVKKGRVTQIREFGVFVDLGGIDGLIPLRELSYERVRAEDVVSLGDVVEVQVKAIDQKGEKTEITLSLKALGGDPWTDIETLAPIGRVIAGQVSRLAEFGAFVRIASGVEGLLHISELGARVRQPSDVLKIGEPILVRVVSVDPVKKRVGLAPASEGAAPGTSDRGVSLVVGSIVQATVEKVEHYGVVVQIVGSKGRAGRATVPNAETATREGSDLRREFPPGKVIVAKVIETSERRTRLSIKAAKDDVERADFDTYRAESASQSTMGTFGDLLKGKL